MSSRAEDEALRELLDRMVPGLKRAILRDSERRRGRWLGRQDRPPLRARRDLTVLPSLDESLPSPRVGYSCARRGKRRDAGGHAALLPDLPASVPYQVRGA